MTVTLNSAGGASVPNWTLLQSTSATSVASVTFSGLSGYSNYRVAAHYLYGGIQVVNTAIQINNDTGSNYAYWSLSLASTTSFTPATLDSATSIPIISTNGVRGSFVCDIDKAMLASPKNLVFSGGSSGWNNGEGSYSTSSSISSIKVFNTGGFTYGSGTFYLYGAN